MNEANPYKAYAEDTILNASPLGLVVALYEGAIEASVTARRYLAQGDIPARTKAINKLTNILTELMRSLDDEKGGEVSANLRRLYAYMHGRVLDAHLKKSAAPLEEVEKLLSIMLEGWRVANANFDPTRAMSEAPALVAAQQNEEESCAPYGNYFADPGDLRASLAYSF